MKIIHNKDLDLNLLYTLYVLLEEQNVSRAASRLMVSQSAVSHALKKLRESFDDPLLVKTRHGMVPTPTADEVRGNLQIIIEHVSSLFRQDRFDPAMAKGTIRVATTDYGASIIFPPLMQRLADFAPHIKMDCVPLSPQMNQDLQNGLIDIAFGGYKPFDGALHEVIFYDRYVGVVRSGHPILKVNITREGLLKWKHVFIKVPIRTERKDRLYKLLGHNLSEEFHLKIPYHMIGALAVEKNDMILIMPEKGSRWLARLSEVTVFELPVKINDHAYLQSWHWRSNNDKMHQWFRSQVKDVCKGTIQSGEGLK